MNKKILLLTACITPGGMAYTKLQNPKVREQQYLHALKWYLENTNFPIVMCENTNYQLPREFDQFVREKRLEYLTFDGNNSFDKTRGKGFGEALIIQYAINNSQLLLDAEVVMKMTGRQILHNINFISKYSQHSNCIYANCCKQNLGIMEAFSQFYICPKEFYTKIFLKDIGKLNDSRFYYFEHLLYDSMVLWKQNGYGNFSEFWMPLKIEGVSGSRNEPLSMKSFPWLRSLLKFLMHKVGYYRQFDNGIFTDSQIREYRFT